MIRDEKPTIITNDQSKMVMKKLAVVGIIMTIVCYWATDRVLAQGCEQAQEFYSEGVALSDDTEQEANFYRQAISLCP